MTEHRHWRDDTPEEVAAYRCRELSEHVCLEAMGPYFGEPDDAPSVGFFFRHDVPGATERCTGGVHVRRSATDRAGPTWSQSGSLEGGDLTLSPSIRCVTHDGGPDAHGFVQAGRWVPA